MYDRGIKSSWTENIWVQRAVNARMTGNPETHWLNWFFTEYLGYQPAKVLSIGCGDGSHELIIARQKYAEHVYGFDASASGIEKASRQAKEEGLNAEFSVKLFEEFSADPPNAAYDIAIFAGSLHHVKDIEDMLFAVQKAVKRDGLILVNEYVGPAYQLYSDKQLAVINCLLNIMPQNIKVREDFELVTPTMRTIYETDPSEGVRAPLIPILLPKFFNPLFQRKMNGALLHGLFDGLDGMKINDGSKQSNAVVLALIELEDMLSDSNFLNSDFLFGLYSNDMI